MDKQPQLEIWAHRFGAGDSYKENSIEALKNSLKNDVDKIETDVWLHKDKLVLTHDEPADGDYPTLDEALKIIDGKAQIYLEIKHYEATIPVHELIVNGYVDHYDTIVFASFDVESLKLVRETSDAARIGLNYRGIDNAFIDIAEDLKAEYVAFNWKRVLPNFFNIKQSREALGIKHLTYTVNTPMQAKIAKFTKMDGIITDYPSKFIEVKTD